MRWSALLVSILLCLRFVGCAHRDRTCGDQRDAHIQAKAADERDPSLQIRLRSGWGIRIESDGSGEYGYGDSFPMIWLPANTFNYVHIRDRLMRRSTTSAPSDGSRADWIVGRVYFIPVDANSLEDSQELYLYDPSLAKEIFDIAHSKETSPWMEDVLRECPVIPSKTEAGPF